MKEEKNNADGRKQIDARIPGAGKFMSLIILALFSSIIVAALFISNTSITGAGAGAGAGNELTGNIVVPVVPQVDYGDLKDKPPTYTNIKVTAYYTPRYEDFNSWCSPSKGSCFTSTDEISTYYKSSGITSCVKDDNAGYCCIPQKDRGFYEEVKCQGSGVYNGKVYSYAAILPQQGQGSPLDERKYTSGRTAKDTNPAPKRTIAVNPKRGSKCYIPYMTNVYLYFGEGNAWNGVYVAEDTGSAFSGECKIDIYTGVGKDTVKAALEEQGTEYPKVYILDEKGEYDYRFTSADISSAGNVANRVPQTGIYSVPYSYSYELEDYAKLYEEAFRFTEEAIGGCYNLPLAEKDRCIEGIIARQEIKLEKSQCTTAMGISGIRAEHKYADVEGKITFKTTVQQVGGEEQSSVTVKDDTGEIKIIFKGTAKTMPNLYTVGQEIIIKDAFLEKNERTVTDPSKIQASTPESVGNLRGFTLGIADCMAAEQDECRCEIEYAGKDKLLFTTGMISLGSFKGNDTAMISTGIYQQDMAALDRIAAGSPDFSHDFSVSTTKSKTFWKKENEKIILYYNEELGKELPQCEIKHKHYAFCAALKKDILKQTSEPGPADGSLEPKEYELKFSLRI